MTTIFTAALNADNGGNQGYSFRQRCDSLSAGSSGQVRVTFKAASAATFNVDTASIGIWTGLDADTTLTPVQLLFSASASFSIANGATVTSDWATLAGFTSSDSLIVVFDINAATGGDFRDLALAGTYQWLKAATASYNQSTTPAGGSTLLHISAVTTIETQSAIVSGPLMGQIVF